MRRPEQNKRETCAFELDKTEVVFGVWHSLATEGRLQPLLETWGRRAQVVLLASSVGVRESKLFREGVPGSRPHLLGDESLPCPCCSSHTRCCLPLKRVDVASAL